MELNLPQKEFDLLACLMRNKGIALSRDLLLERVWGFDFMGDSRTVDVHIRWLRGKIETDPSHPCYIQTVRGVGYRFEVPEEQPLDGKNNDASITGEKAHSSGQKS
jgi:DNA-binding response OmpR family regulator